MVSDAQKRANEKYRKENVKQIAVRFYPGEHDIYEYLKSKNNVSGYVKQLIRNNMESAQ